jgi:hypothetical protein
LSTLLHLSVTKLALKIPGAARTIIQAQIATGIKIGETVGSIGSALNDLLAIVSNTLIKAGIAVCPRISNS